MFKSMMRLQYFGVLRELLNSEWMCVLPLSVFRTPAREVVSLISLLEKAQMCSLWSVVALPLINSVSPSLFLSWYANHQPGSVINILQFSLEMNFSF